MNKEVNQLANLERENRTFKIEDKMKELQDLVGEALLHLHVVVAVPSRDKHMRLIFLEDEELYTIQQNNADALAQYIMYNLGADIVSMFHKFDGVEERVDYVIFLHEFTASEKNAILEKFMHYNADLKYFEL